MAGPVLLPLIVDGRYRLERLLAHGGGSAVYQAIDLDGGAAVAVKLGEAARGDARAWQRFEREASALALIGGEHVVRVLAVGRAAELDAPYLVMELLDGEDLARELARRGPLSAAETVRWFAQAASALELAHGVGIVHRDLKPANLFLHRPPGGGERVVKLLDFGLVKRLEAEGAAGVDEDAFAGTPHYMAPEQVRGHAARIGPAADVWALGMVALAMLTASPYWPGETADEVLRAIVGQPLVAPSSRWSFLPEGFDAWFRRSCDRVPERRFSSALAQADALARALAPLLSSGPASRDEAASDVAATLTFGGATQPAAAPAPPRALVGRDVERRELDDRLRRAEGQLITVTGAGGTGKTRLAEEVAAGAADAFPGGVWVVPLGPLRDPAAVPEAIADALLPKRDAVIPLAEQLAAALRDRRALVVLDGFEHLVAARGVVAELRGRAPRVSWLVTSRAPLGLADEERFPLAPLDVPAAGPVSVREAAQYSAVQLFVDRARAASPGFELTADNAAAIAEICRRLDGLPLAIELAAARVRRLDERRVPERTGPGKGRLADIGEQQRTIRAAIAWSYELLTEEERAVFRRVAVCPGGVTAAAARAVAGAEIAGVERVLALLVDSSLLQQVPDAGDGAGRYRMLETVREYGLEALAAAGEERLARRRALDHALALGDEAAVGLRGGDQAQTLGALAAELDNLRAALGWALADAPEDALRLAAGLAWFWYLRGHYREGSAWLEAALARCPGAAGELRAPALLGAGELAFLQCNYGRAAGLLEESAAAARRLSDARGAAAAEQLLGSIAREQGDYALAAQRHERARAAWVALGDRREEGRSLNYLAFVGWLSGGELPRAATQARRARAIFADVGDREGRVWSSLNLGAAAFYAGDLAAAAQGFEEAFHDSVAVRFQEGIAWSLNMQGLCSLARRGWTRAAAQLRASLNLHRKIGDLWRAASVLEALAVLSVELGAADRAALVLGSAAAVRRRIAAPVPACERPLLDSALDRLRGLLGAALDARLAQGEVLPLDEALAAALDEDSGESAA